MSEPLISVIIPVYNVQDYVVDCAQSLFDQSSKDFEVFFVDDGSEDKSIAVLRIFLHDHQISDWHIVTKKNGGLSSARNLGLSLSSGKYVWFVDSDDIIAPNSIELLEKLMTDGLDYDSILFRYVKFESHPPVSKQPAILEKRVIDGATFLDSLLKRRRQDFAWSYVAKRSLYNAHSITFPSGRTFEDMATTYKIAYFSGAVCEITNELYYYRARPGSISKLGSEKHANDIYENLKSFRKFFQAHNSSIFVSSADSFFAYYALQAYQQTYSNASFRQLKRIFEQLDVRRIEPRYVVAYILARLHLLKSFQRARTAMR